MINYVIAAYGGRRRHSIPRYDADSSYLLRTHLRALSEVKHRLDRVTIVAPPRDKRDRFQDRFEAFLTGEVPATVGGAPVTVIRRTTNSGFSYGSWSDAYKASRGKFDWYVFMEDDYYFALDGFDDLLVEESEKSKDCGFLAAKTRQDPGQVHFADIFAGLFRASALEDLFVSLGRLPHSDSSTNYESIEIEGQIGFSAQLEARTKWRIRPMIDRWVVEFFDGYGLPVRTFGEEGRPVMMRAIHE